MVTSEGEEQCNDDVEGNRAGRAVIVGHRQDDRVGARLGVGVARRRSRVGLAIAEVPVEPGDGPVGVSRTRRRERRDR